VETCTSQTGTDKTEGVEALKITNKAAGGESESLSESKI
jgi:hypothetical protein